MVTVDWITKISKPASCATLLKVSALEGVREATATPSLYLLDSLTKCSFMGTR